LVAPFVGFAINPFAKRFSFGKQVDVLIAKVVVFNAETKNEFRRKKTKLIHLDAPLPL
jgi:hypothetical protein